MKSLSYVERISRLLELAPESIRQELGVIDGLSDTPEHGNIEVKAMALFYACRSISSVEKVQPLVEGLTIDAMTLHSLITIATTEEFAKTHALDEEIRKNKASSQARKAVRSRHKNPKGRTQEVAKAKAQVIEEWKTGRYSDKDRCAEEMCGALGISFSTARKALRNI